MAVYFVLQGRVDDRAKLAEYQEKVGATITPDLKVLAIDETPEVIEGEPEYLRTVVLEFPSKDSFRAWYDSSAYQAIAGLRKEAVSGHAVLAQGAEH